MRLIGKADTTLKLAPNKELFIRPMSHGARDLLYSMVDWGCTKLHLFGNNSNLMMSQFGDHFSQIKYEEVEQSFNTDQYIKIIVGTPGDKKNNGIRVKNAADVISAMALDMLYDNSWVHNNAICRKNHVGDITQYDDLYNWIITKFMLGDFPSYDIGKIVEMGRLCSFDTVKREAQQITDPDKRNISYLYAIIRGVHSRDNASQRQNKTAENASANKLNALIDMAMNAKDKTPFKSDLNAFDTWEREREFIDILRDLDKD